MGNSCLFVHNQNIYMYVSITKNTVNMRNHASFRLIKKIFVDHYANSSCHSNIGLDAIRILATLSVIS